MASNLKIIVAGLSTWYLYHYRLRLLRSLVSKGFQVLTLASADSYQKRIESHGVKHIKVDIVRTGINPLQEINLLHQFLKVYKKHKPDIVQHFTIKVIIYGSIAAKIVGVKHIYNAITGLGYSYSSNSIKRIILRTIINSLCRCSLKFSSHVYFQNEDDRNYFIRRRIVTRTNTCIIPGSGVDTSYYKPIAKRETDKITFILVSRMIKDKGIIEYVEAAHKLRKRYNNVEFLLLGPLDSKHPTSITQKQLRYWTKMGDVKYLGETNDVRYYLKSADVIVLPSYYREGLPLSLLEGAAMGMPIITADSTGCREVVED
ncbi:glycosyltransferase, partial [candidate division WOR-3 bacterium]|nr:glycosyltransferase [candidate division WOR-3 bacterium]